MQEIFENEQRSIELLPGAVLEMVSLGDESSYQVSATYAGPSSGFVPASGTLSGLVPSRVGPFAGLVVLSLTTIGRVGVHLHAPQGVRTQTVAGNLKVMSGSATLMEMQNMGTEQDPTYDFRASVLPRSGTLAELTALTSGGGELCYATDVPAIVQLRGAGPNGTATVFGELPLGVWDADNSWLSSPIGVEGLSIRARDSEGGGGELLLNAGNGSDAGGHAYLHAGNCSGAGDGGGVYIQSGGGTPGEANGIVSIVGGWVPGTVGGGNIVIRPGNQGDITLQRSNQTAVMKVTAAGALGFFNAAGVTQPTVSGSRGGNAALASVLTALANLGLIINSSTA